MIALDEQNKLFKLIASLLKKDIKCIAIGGTAMMYLGHKTTTKDIDLIFQTKEDQDVFINALEKLGYKERLLFEVYDEKRRNNPTKPRMFSRGDERFDLFVKKVFGFELNFNLDQTLQRQDFVDEKTLIIQVLREELLILLKAVTNREKDLDDIITIIKNKPEIDWKYVVELAIEQKNNNGWILFDLEEKLRSIEKVAFIKNEIFELIYAAQERD